MLDVLLFLAAGIALGVLFGLVPGLHPNTLVLAVPLLAALGTGLPLLALVVGMAVANSITDFIPSILLGAPDSDSALSVLPGHQMLMEGYGYQAIKLTVIGGLFSVIVTLALLPLLAVGVPPLFAALRPWTHILLIFIAAFLIVSERGARKLLATLFFFASGSVGILAAKLPVDGGVALFPILAGLFGTSTLLLQLRTRSKVPPQKREERYVSRKIINRSVVMGTLGGIASGLLPGVGSSSIAALASVDKQRESFLTTMGAITTANILLSMLSLWLISRPRSGAAVIIDQLSSVGFAEFVYMVLFAAVAAAVASVATLKLAKLFVARAQHINYAALSYAVLIFIALATFAFAGAFGLLLLAVCTALGVACQLSGVRRSILMGVLMLPVILFFAPV